MRPLSRRPAAEAFLRENWAPCQVPRMHTHPHCSKPVGRKKQQDGSELWGRGRCGPGRGESCDCRPPAGSARCGCPRRRLASCVEGSILICWRSSLLLYHPGENQLGELLSTIPFEAAGRSLHFKWLPHPPVAFSSVMIRQILSLPVWAYAWS